MSGARDRLERLSPEKRALLLRRLQGAPGADEAAEAWPTLEPDLSARHEPFPLTPLQEAYWVGRDSGFEMGRVATHSYMELEGDLDLARLEGAWNRLIERHDMLRARFLPDGRQETLARVPRYEIPVERLEHVPEPEAAARLASIRERMSHQVLDASEWPLFDLRAARLPAGRVRLFLGVDALIVDAWSVKILFEEWSALYQDPGVRLPALELTFRDYVLGLERLRETERFERARRYWRERAGELPPPPALPLRRSPGELEAPRFVRRTETLPAASWRRLQSRAAATGMTSTAVTLAAYADVLALWSERPDFTLSVPQFNRHPLHPSVDRIVGECASFALLDVRQRAGTSFAERARRHQERLWEDLDHAEFGGVRVLRELARLRPGTAPAMPVIFTSAPQGGEGGGVGAALPEGPWRVVYVNNQSSQVWLDNHLSERGGALVCDWDTVDDLFPDGMPGDMLGAFMGHLERLAADEEWWDRTWVEVARDLLPATHVAVHDAANDTDAPIPERLVQDAFFQRAAAAPDATAVLAGNRRIGYGELAGQVLAWAERMRRAGMAPGDRVGIVMRRGWEQVVAAYAVLETGAAYLPLDADDPPRRRERLLARADVAAVLLQPELEGDGGWPEGLPLLPVTWLEGSEAEAPREGGVGTPDDVAFVLYTSGSTGEPKAVQIEHRGVVNALEATVSSFGISAEDRALALTALHHDMSVFDLFGVLGAGGRIVLPDPAGRRDPAHWAELMRAEGVTVWNSVPAMMTMLLARADEGSGEIPGSLRLAFLGGDWIPVTLPDRLRKHVPAVEIVSVGGPTETTLWNIWHRIGEVDPTAASIPYGAPIANARYHVLGEPGVERPLWVPGELCVSGVGVTRGYLDDEAATAARRGTHPRTGEPVWRTGDLGRRRLDGEIEFLGRSDLQIQLRGHRVEPGEIEAHATRYPGVRAAAVAPFEHDRGGIALAAHVVWAGEPDPEGLTDWLADRLPAHMIPSALLTAEELPLTANGKVDRRALPAPSGDASAPGAGAPAPRERETAGGGSRIERTVLEIVVEVLSRDVPLDGNLLEQGANSIDMVRIGNRLEERLGGRPAIDEIFRLQTPAALAAWYEEYEEEAEEDAVPAAADPVAHRLASYRVALEPEEREAFKARQAGVRRDLPGEGVALDHPEAATLDDEVWRRRSHRRFALRPIGRASFGGFLGGLAQRTVQSVSKRLYASPGGLYPTQVYVHVKPGRVEGVAAGAYYHHPLEHRLIALAPGARIERDIHVPFVNAPVFDEAAFSLFFVVDLDAIGPSYGERSLHFATLEAGVMCAALEAWAPRWGIGLCQIGDIRFESIRHLFRLGESHVFLHSMLGGASAGDGPESRELAGASEEDARQRLLDRVRDLSPGEVERLLAEREDGGTS